MIYLTILYFFTGLYSCVCHNVKICHDIVWNIVHYYFDVHWYGNYLAVKVDYQISNIQVVWLSQTLIVLVPYTKMDYFLKTVYM